MFRREWPPSIPRGLWAAMITRWALRVAAALAVPWVVAVALDVATLPRGEPATPGLTPAPVEVASASAHAVDAVDAVDAVLEGEAAQAPRLVGLADFPEPPQRAVAEETTRLLISAIGVDAAVATMGVDGAGVLEVPGDADTVAWYDFSAGPGQSGNVVMSGHLDYGGEQGVFYRLRDLSPGHEIVVRSGDSELRYVVEQSYPVRPQEADLSEILGARSGAETITLITCGGQFDLTSRQYEQRTIVRARRLFP